ncbi:hypothetical protein [Bradyrhizobium sp. USDA 3315]
MRRGLLVLLMFIGMAVSGQDVRAAEFGTRYSYQQLQDLTEKGPKGEALALGYVSLTHSFILPYKMTGYYALMVKGSGRDLNRRPLNVYHELSQEKIEQMQRAGALPNPLPPYRRTIFEYMFGYVLWWCIPAALLIIGMFSMLGIGSGKRGQA